MARALSSVLGAAAVMLTSPGQAFVAPTTGVSLQRRSGVNFRLQQTRGVDGGIECSGAAAPIVELVLDFERKSPVETLKELSQEAELYGIEEQDVYGGNAEWFSNFETEVASLLGKEAAVFCPSGVMAQLIALKIHATSAGRDGAGDDGDESAATQHQHSFLCHSSSHLLLHEHDAHKELLGFDAVRIGAPERPVSCADLREALWAGGEELTQDASGSTSRPSCFVLELPHRELGGACTSLEDIEEMAKVAAVRGMAFHCDGARLWEAQAYYGASFSDVCSSFDSVYVSFYKGLGGMTGAMLVGSTSFMEEARIWLRRFGGNVYTSLPYAVSCLHAFRTQIGTFESRWHKLTRVASLIDAVALEKVKEHRAGTGEDLDPSDASRLEPLARVRFEPPTPQCSMVHCYVRGSQEILERARDAVLRTTGIKVFNRLRGMHGAGTNGRPDECYFEWNMGPANGAIDDQVFVDAWSSFLDEIERLEE